MPKAKGGLGLRDLGCLNQALLAKVAWRLLKNPDSSLAKVLVGKYCRRQGLLEAAPSSLAAWGWRGVVWGKELLCKGLKWRIGNGRSIGVFRDEWIPKKSNPLVGSPLSSGLPNFRVMDLFDARCHVWRDPLLNVLFPREVVSAIHSIYLPLHEKEDELIWEHTKNGLFSVKSAHLSCFGIKTPSSFCGRFGVCVMMWYLRILNLMLIMFCMVFQAW